MKWKKPLGHVMVKIFGKIQHELCVEGSELEGFKGGTQGVVWESYNFLG